VELSNHPDKKWNFQNKTSDMELSNFIRFKKNFQVRTRREMELSKQTSDMELSNHTRQ
jgi:hypothetical protein